MGRSDGADIHKECGRGRHKGGKVERSIAALCAVTGLVDGYAGAAVSVSGDVAP